MFTCLFLCLLIFFYFNNLGTPTWSYPENFVKIQLDLAEIFRILKKFICLLARWFVYWFVFFILITLAHPQEVTMKMLWRSNLIWLKYLGSKNCLFVCLFVCWPVCSFILIILELQQEYTLKISRRSHLIWLRY